MPTEAAREENLAKIDELRVSVPRPVKSRLDWALQIIRDFLGLVAVVALGVSLWNLAEERTSVMCQASLLQNFSSQADATKDAVTAIENAAQVQATSTAAQAADLGVMVDPAQTVEARTAATDDFRAQSEAIATAWQTYVTARTAADAKSAANPVAFRC
jgi:FtsZ-interacting cell division protein ZipA